VSVLGDWPLPTIGGRLRIARNPNQGIFCSLGQKTLENLAIKAGLQVHSESTKSWSENQLA
jgi:hypothetical protein